MSNTPILLPCPFCGKTHSLIVGAASEAWDADEHGPYPHTESYAVFCDASTDGRRGGCGGAGGYRLTKDEAIEAWNRRTPQPVVREPLTDEQIDDLIAAKHFREGYELTASDKVCINWYRLGLRDGERIHNITQKGGSNAE